MAINPMQRKAQNSFLLGILVTLLITGLIIGFLVLQLTKLTKAQKEAEAALKTVYESLLARIEALEAQNSDTTT